MQYQFNRSNDTAGAPTDVASAAAADGPSSGRAGAASLAQRYAGVRAATLKLVEPLSDEDCQVQSMPDASPAKWHLAHLTWFFETFLLERFERDFKPFDASFRVLFNSYYQGIGEQYPRARRGLITRPTLADVKRYRAAVDARMLALIAERGEDDTELRSLVVLGLHHEQQHQELLLTDIKHALSFSAEALDAGDHPDDRGAERPAYAKRWPLGAVQAQPLAWFRFDGGLFELGHDPDQDGEFCFDNETPRHRAYTAPFELASRPLNNADYQAFIDDGGYQRAELWLSMGWDWVRADDRRAPLYWRRRDGRWLTHTLQGSVALDPNTPVCHLSYFEAEACARWSGARLPTEAEWEFAARRASPRALQRANFADRGAFHPLPPAGASNLPAPEPLQLFGDVWEWTQSSYAAYPGYRAPPGAVGEYNGKFMCQQLVLRGGSCATPAGHVRASYRNFFPPEAQWQFSGVRLARDV